MPSPNSGPITGRERIRVIQGGWEVWIDRSQFTSLIALASSAPSPRPMATPTAITGTETVDAWQDGNRIILTAADLTTFLAGSGNAPAYPDAESATAMTGAERIVGHQDGSRIAFSVAELLAVRAGGGVTAPTAVGTLDHRYFEVGSGPQTFSIASGFSGSGITYTIRSFPTGASLTINASTGVMTAQTSAPVNSTADGNVVIRATNSAGYVEQSFPLFVVVLSQFTVLAREANGTVTVESLAPSGTPTLVRQVDGSVSLTEIL